MGDIVRNLQGRAPLVSRPHAFHNIRTIHGPPTLDLVGGPRDRYDIIYADPPWNFENYSELGEDRNAKSWYACMKIEDLFDIWVSALADPDCALFMWVTEPPLEDRKSTRLTSSHYC